MLVCDSHRFVFVHIHRTGGTSIAELCSRLAIETQQPYWQHTHLGSEKAQGFPFHRYRVVAFVRNPWDRLHSWYQLFRRFNPRRDQEHIGFEEFLTDYDLIARAHGLDGEFRFNQLDYLETAEGRADSLLLGRFETYADEVRRVFATLGIDVGPIPRLNGAESPESFPRESSALHDWVTERCARDIEAFGFDPEADRTAPAGASPPRIAER